MQGPPAAVLLRDVKALWGLGSPLVRFRKGLLPERGRLVTRITLPSAKGYPSNPLVLARALVCSPSGDCAEVSGMQRLAVRELGHYDSSFWPEPVCASLFGVVLKKRRADLSRACAAS